MVGAGKMKEATGVQAAPKMPPAGDHTKQILHQGSKLPHCPARMAVGGFAVALTIGYLALYSKKKPEATAMDVAKVASGVSTTDNTRPRN